ncbi:MAG: hypothetical protein WDA59_07620 [Methanofastidiosum sp.]
MIKCIKEKCPMYLPFKYDLHIINTCKIKPWIELKDECIGFDYIDLKKEDKICKISKLTTEVNILAELKNYIKDNQDD